MRLPIIVLCLFANSAAAQNISVQFRDGAPKDSITLANAGCPIMDAAITLDLSGSAGGLIFDTTAKGAGVEVFQPVEILTGNVVVSPVADGDTRLDMTIAQFTSDAAVQLTADLDDTIAGGRQITVTGSEISGATVSIATNETIAQGVFDDAGTAYIDLTGACLPS